jgi:hypothetical protein
MNEQTLQKAIDEAERFLPVARAAVVRIASDRSALMGSKETAAAKRASMDLTRALAEMRRSS